MNSSNTEELVQCAVKMILAAHYIVAFTGAGISTPSGIPDFRSEKDGLWRRYNPMKVASRSAFYHSPDLFFDWFRPLFMSSWKAQPNPAHLGLATLENMGNVKSVITQNIDGLHQKAGSTRVLELHGTAMSFTCSKCSKRIPAEVIYNQFVKGDLIPYCTECKSIIKPDVVLFEEGLPQDIWMEAQNEAMEADLMLVIGSSLEVYPANTIPQAAIRNESKLIINNLSSTSMDILADLRIPMDAALFFSLVIDQISN